MTTITLTEYAQTSVPFARLTESQVALLQTHFAQQVRIELLVGGEKQWRLTAAGWVGTIPLGGVTVAIRPKIATHNLFQMLAIAYDMPIRPLDGEIRVDAIDGLFHAMATWLIDGILQRIQRGLHRAYVPTQATLPYLRGRLRVRALTHDLTSLPVAFSDFSADIPHNQLLLYTLHRLRTLFDLPQDAHNKLNHAYRTLRNSVTLREYAGHDIDALTYDRLNADYQPLHALCRFFLDGIAPFDQAGSLSMRPFLLDMATLFERFVARRLAGMLPASYTLVTQERTALLNGDMRIAIDLVIKDRSSGDPVCVLDTKWKSAEKPANSDLYQIHFYANATGSRCAGLVYPTPLATPLDANLDGVLLRSLVFDVSAEVDRAGEQFMIQVEELLSQRRKGAKTQREES